MTHFERISEINAIVRANVERARSENRDFTEAETAENNSLLREKRWLQLEIESTEMQRERKTKTEESALVAFVRAAARGKQAVTAVIRAEGDAAPAGGDQTHLTDDLGALQPVTVGEIIEEVEEQLIWHLLGIKMPTNLAGQYEWPVVGDVEATFAGEGVELDPVKVDISKISAVQQRVGITMAVTRESIFNSAGKIEEIVREKEPKAIAKAINKVVLSPVKIDGQSLEGPFVNATKKSVTFDFKGLNGAKADLLKEGFDEDSLVFVMDYATKAELEATPKDSGSGIMVIENGKLCGRPVFCASVMDGKIGLGDFRYQVIGQFGNPEMIVDPYTQAKKGKVEITTNANFGSATLSQKAFVLLSKKA